MFKKLLIFALITTLAHQSTIAQNLRWEIGGMFGLSTYSGDLIKPSPYDFGEFNVAYGFLIRHNVHPNISLRLNALRGELSGNDLNYTDRVNRGFRFSSPITEGSLMLEIDILGHLRYKNVRFRKVVSPYIFGGVGLAFFDQNTFYNEAYTHANLDEIKDDKRLDTKRSLLAVPFGMGIKSDLSPNWTLGVEWGIRPVFSDMLDGVNQSGNPSDNDFYSFGSLTLVFRFGEPDSDKDGIKDKFDKCPNIPGQKSADGCPDRDDDGLRDSKDNCPDEAGRMRFQGCPDSDHDKIPDHIDQCPDEPGVKENLGCPIVDRDDDGVSDDVDQCPDKPGRPEHEGCPDTDYDGVLDHLDDCPELPGLAMSAGCPDSDNDGVFDPQDRCPTIPGLIDGEGCPDSDGDGIIDPDDKCPDTGGNVDIYGCPELTEKELAVLDFASRNIFFVANSEKILERSFEVLDQVLDIMKRFKNYNLRLDGYTDDRGNEVVNQQLSERRAELCYEYLVINGIRPSRITYQGYGETNPIADNNTPEGRAKNRRVEFYLIKQK